MLFHSWEALVQSLWLLSHHWKDTGNRGARGYCNDFNWSRGIALISEFGRSMYECHPSSFPPVAGYRSSLCNFRSVYSALMSDRCGTSFAWLGGCMFTRFRITDVGVCRCGALLRRAVAYGFFYTDANGVRYIILPTSRNVQIVPPSELNTIQFRWHKSQGYPP